MKNLKLRQGKVAIMSLTIFILMFTMVFSLDIPEYSEKAAKNEPYFLLQNIKASANPSSFISVWNTTLTSDGSSGTNQVKLPLEWAVEFGFRIDGDYILIENVDISGFIDKLDEQFKMWKNSEKNNKGKSI